MPVVTPGWYMTLAAVLFVLGTASMFSFVLTFERLPHLLDITWH